MTGRPVRQGVLPAYGGPVLHPGTSRDAWCPSCRAWTSVAADLLLLSVEGVSSAGTLTWCDVCEDPRDPLPARRIDHA